eukprot:ANDGO_06731.mRNA.1 Cysteine desulfurase
MSTTLQAGVFFDCNSTTPTLPHAADAALQAMQIMFGNPSSHHLVGLQAKHTLENSRRVAAALLKTSPECIVFTSGATEAIQLAVLSVLQHISTQSPSEMCELLYLDIEHKAVPQALHYWNKTLKLPCRVVPIPVNAKGKADLVFLREHAPHARMVCTMAVNNETGVIQDLSAISTVLAETNSRALWFVDGVQALGKLPIDLSEDNDRMPKKIDYMCASLHKVYGPKGCGFLYMRKGVPLSPLIVGGGQESGKRSGTENLPGVAALGSVLIGFLPDADRSKFSASEDAKKFHFQSDETLCKFRDCIVRHLKEVFPKIIFITPFDCSVPTCINFSVPGFSSKEILDMFDAAGVRLSAGSACSAASTAPSHVLVAMGIDDAVARSACRLSFGPATTQSEIDFGCRAIKEIGAALSGSGLFDQLINHVEHGEFDIPPQLRHGVIQLRGCGASNTWIISHRLSRTCVVIDPLGSDAIAERIDSFVHSQNLKVMAVVDTHSHADHASSRPVIAEFMRHSFASPDGAVDNLGWPTSREPFVMDIFLQNGMSVPAIILGPHCREVCSHCCGATSSLINSNHNNNNNTNNNTTNTNNNNNNNTNNNNNECSVAAFGASASVSSDDGTHCQCCCADEPSNRDTNARNNEGGCPCLPSTADKLLAVARVPTPGHTTDSVTFLYGIVDFQTRTLSAEHVMQAFVGDTVLTGGLGRTNFSTSDPVALFHSLRMLSQICGPNTMLCPAHDYSNSFATRFGVECQENALLRDCVDTKTDVSSALKSFLVRKETIDLNLSRLEDSFQGMVCGVTPTSLCSMTADIQVSWAQMVDLIQSKDSSHFCLVDVRESQEYAVWKPWDRMGLPHPPRNVPISRFVNFMSEVLSHKPDTNTKFILFCRSGNRSLQAAKSLRRIGFPNVYSLEGGVALGIPVKKRDQGAVDNIIFEI